MNQETMQAIRFYEYGGPDVLKLEEILIPEPLEGEVLVRVHSAGVLPIEWKIRQGLLKFPMKFPSIPGTAFAGVIAGVGKGVVTLQLGQAVFGRSTNGTYSEYTTAAAAALVPLPASMSFDEAATISGGATTAWQALINEAKIKQGDRVLIHGAAGGVGLYATQFAKWKGAYVIGTCGSANVEFVRSLGADEVIDYSTERFEAVVKDMDIVLDTMGGETLEHSWSVVKQEGMIISLVALPSQERAALNNVKAIKPTALASNPDLEEIAELIHQGVIKTFISRIFTLEQAGEAQALSQRGHGRGRIVLHIQD